MNMKKWIYRYSVAAGLLAATLLTACNKNDTPTFPEPTTYDMSGFVKGADVSWLTEMEYSGRKFYDAQGRQTELMRLLRDNGMNAIRLRVWVNPADGWCDKADVLVKALRAHQLGFRLMIDFHYSDSWADPGKQIKPKAWEGLTSDEVKTALANHTKDVLQTLKNHNIPVEWVQVGNETRNGMVYPDGNAKTNPMGFAALVTAGYDAVKAVYPDAKVIVHIDKGNQIAYYTYLFDILKANGAKWDIIGMSLYPEPSNGDDWKQQTDDLNSNITTLKAKYGIPTLVCEVGMNWDETQTKDFFTYFVSQCKQNPDCLGIFTWEPQAYAGWKGYTKGMFDDSGHPIPALSVFKQN